LLCAFQGDGGDNPPHSIPAGRKHTGRLAGHAHGNAACRNPTCRPFQPKPLPPMMERTRSDRRDSIRGYLSDQS
jgi:hypothetical protein